MTCVSNYPRLFYLKAKLHVNCSDNRFTKVGSPSGGGLTLHIPEVACLVLIITRCYAEQEVKDGDQPIAVNRKEGETIKSLQAAFCKNPQELEGCAASICQGAHTSRLMGARK